MNNNRLIWIMILGMLFISFKIGKAAKTQVEQAYKIQESQLEKAMMDID